MVPVRPPARRVRESYNAVFIEGDAVGELMLYGRGAGGGPTASAVLGDLIDAAKNLVGGRGRRRSARCTRRRSGPIDELESQFYLSLEVADRPGVLAAIAGVFGEHGVSIQSMQQKGHRRRRPPHLRHPPPREADMRATIRARARRRRRRPGRLGAARRRRRGDEPGRLARGHRGVPRPAPGHRQDAGRHAARGQHAAGRAPRLSEQVGAEVYLKVEGANPTGSFKDRGMTLAMSKAVEEGAKAVICASTGNTSASAAAYAARAGLICAGASSPRATSRSASSRRR